MVKLAPMTKCLFISIFPLNLHRNIQLKVPSWPLIWCIVQVECDYIQLICHFFLFFITPLQGYTAVTHPCGESGWYAWKNVTPCQHAVSSLLIKSPSSTMLRTVSLSQRWRALDRGMVWKQLIVSETPSNSPAIIRFLSAAKLALRLLK